MIPPFKKEKHGISPCIRVGFFSRDLEMREGKFGLQDRSSAVIRKGSLPGFQFLDASGPGAWFARIDLIVEKISSSFVDSFDRKKSAPA